MRAQPASQENHPAAIVPTIVASMPWRVAKAEAKPEHKLAVEFLDGVTGIVDMANFVHSATAGVFAALADPALFAQVQVEHGAIIWPGNLDLAPDAMHRAIKASGRWVL